MEALTRRNVLWIAACIVALFALIGYRTLFAPPTDFPSGSLITIARGSSAPFVADQLAETHIIAHPSVLRLLLRLSGASGSVHAGTYRFEAPQNSLIVAYRIATGAFGLPPVRITFPEGTTVRDMAAEVADSFPEVKAADFLKAAQPYEGYLFPDTYLFLPSSDAASLVALMRDNFDTKIATIAGEIGSSGRSIGDTVILASLVEKEARSSENRRIVAGILLNRLKLGMPLQVDAVFGYIFGRDTYSPSLEDLTVNSPYNTYTHPGLPPGPICNPGLDSLQAAANPAKTDYLYYLTGKDGLMHYATTYAGHQANRKKYLP
ncbi:MAG: endolytic transglycosylase MltG [Patescibacteria group bacterium]|nr:endolytic transglycosylase MltG [Patescibacteria group bacterium]